MTTTAEAILMRVAREISERGLPAFSFACFKEVLHREGIALEEHFADEPTLLRAVMLRSSRNVGADCLAAISAAANGSDALEGFVRAWAGYYFEHLDEYEVGFVWRQVAGLERYGLDAETLQRDFIPILNPPLDAVEAKLEGDRGSRELPGGIHPRRLAFIGQIMALGLISSKAISKRLGSPLKHGDDALLREACRSLAGPIKSLRQLSALNEAAAELARLRDEASLHRTVPALMARIMELEAPTFTMAVDHALDAVRSTPIDGGGIELAAPIRYEGDIIGAITGRRSPTMETDERDLARMEAFASMVGLALENVRLYEGLQAQLEARTKRLTEAQRRLAETEKMAALGKLVAGVVHELNTPLGVVQSSHAGLVLAAEKVRAKVDDESMTKLTTLMAQGAENANVALRRISEIVAQLKRFSRLDSAEIESLDLKTALDDAVAMLRHEMPARCDMIIETEPDLRIRCWASRVNQVFLHVLRNSIQAIGEDGTVRVKAVRDPESGVRITVRDNGRGIPAEDLERIFEPGFTAKGGRVRAGLGLATSYQVVADHQGEIRIESEVGAGTCVTILLPFDPPSR